MLPTLSVLAMAALPAFAAILVPFGPEFLVNGYTNRPQRDPVVAADATGAFVVAWTRTSQYYGGEGVFAQRIDAAGQPRGGELRVSAAPVDTNQNPPSIAGAADGSFVVAWTLDLDGDVTGIASRRFGPSGSPLGPEFLVNSYTTSFQYQPSVAMDASGGFVVAWAGQGNGDDRGVFAQRFDAAGNRRGAEFRVNVYTTDSQQWPSVAVAPGGSFLVVWNSYGQGGDSWEVFGRRFDAQGVPLASEFHVNAYTPGFQFTPQAAVDGASNFVVVWDDVARGSIAGRRYDAAGNPLGAEFTIGGYPHAARVAAAPNGEFAVVWEGYSSDVFGTRFSAAGTPGSTFRLNHYTLGGQSEPAVAMLPQGLVATWRNQDRRIVARRFGDLGPRALAVDPSAGPASDGNGVFEAGETVMVEPSWANSTAALRLATGVASAFVGPAPDPGYTIVDPQGAYSLPPGAAASCADSINCYVLAVGAPSVRPAPHWDTRFREDVAASGMLPATNWSVHVGDSFADVPRSSGYYRFVETLLHHLVTAGCQPGLYCPGASTTREQIAVFVLRAVEPPWYQPFECSAGNERFADVPATSPFCPWIEELYWRGVVGGCGGGLYCPATPVTREQMAVFVLRALDPTLSPPPCTTPMFNDVPAASPFCAWIEELARRGVVSGCGSGGYCPAAPVTREQMSVFLSETFGLALYGP